VGVTVGEEVGASVGVGPGDVGFCEGGGEGVPVDSMCCVGTKTTSSGGLRAYLMRVRSSSIRHARREWTGGR